MRKLWGLDPSGVTLVGAIALASCSESSQPAAAAECAQPSACASVDAGPPTASDGGATPTGSQPDARAAALAAGRSFGCALRVDGRMKCWGTNDHGELGAGDKNRRGDGPGQMGTALPFVDLGPLGATSFGVKLRHTCAVLRDARVKCWGSNELGHLGLGDNWDHRGDEADEMGAALPYIDLGAGRTVKSVSVGNVHSCAILDGDRLKCWGGNHATGILGLGDVMARGDQPGEMGDSLPFVDLGTGRTVKSVIAGGLHTCAVLDDDGVKCWGFNGIQGVLGLGDANDRGGQPGEMGDALAYVDLGVGRKARSLAAGHFHTCAVLDNGGVKCWGGNGAGGLGLGDLNPRGANPDDMGDRLAYVDLGVGRTAKSVTVGLEHTCAVLDNDRLKCWGDNAFGQLGLGDTNDRGGRPGEMGDALPYVELGTDRTVRRIAAGAFHTCAILDDDRVKCWGNGADGQLALGDRRNRGSGSGEMGDALPYVELGP